MNHVVAYAQLNIIDDELRELTNQKDSTDSLKLQRELDEKIAERILRRSFWECVLRNVA